MPDKLPVTTLGRTGKKASKLGLGGFHQLEISSEIVESVVDCYLEAGGNYIETARSYGNGASEKKLGRALKGRRNQVVLVSKSGSRDAESFQRDLEASLKALQTDYLDFYFFHNVADDENLDKICADNGALKAMRKAIDEGVVGGIGCSSHRPHMYLKAFERIDPDLILIWDNYLDTLFLPEIHNEIYPAARKKGTAITAMKPLGDGMLWENAENALRYSLGSGSDLLVCGMNKVDYVKQAVKAVCAGALSEEEREDVLKTAPELGAYACRQCGKCPKNLRNLFRLEGKVDRQLIDFQEHNPANYALRLRLSGWFGMADEARKEFAATYQDANSLLSEAERCTCPYNIDISRKARLAVAKLSGNAPNLI